MKRFKKLLSILLVSLLVASAAACGTPASSASNTATSTASASSAAGSSTESPATPAEKDYSKHYTIEYALDTTNLEVNNDDFAKLWNEKFNIDYEIIPLTAENSNEMIRIWISAGDLPDVVRWGFNYSEYADWVDQGDRKSVV